MTESMDVSFIMLLKVVLTFKSKQLRGTQERVPCGSSFKLYLLVITFRVCVTIQVKSTAPKYFVVLLFI